MTSLMAAPSLITLAAERTQAIGAALSTARMTAAGPTTGLVAAAQDEVSTVLAQFFGQIGQDYQVLLRQAGAFQDQFVSTLISGANVYTATEVASAAALPNPGPPLTGNVVGLLMGASGIPILPPGFAAGLAKYFLQSNTLQTIYTPENWYPETGPYSLKLTTSVDYGLPLLDAAIKQQIAVGNSVTVEGWSQSAILNSLEMQNLMNSPNAPLPSQLSFVLLGNPMSPDGGLFERFVGFSSLGMDFYGATPPNTPYGISIFNMQYDGYGDWPRYPIDIFADLNAAAGMYYVHPLYPWLNPTALPPGYDLVMLPGSASLPGGMGATNYYIITEPNLPLLEPLRAIPFVGQPFADLLQPDLRALVNWGYGDPHYGYSTGPANVPTPFGVFPPLDDTLALGSLLAGGTQQGVSDFARDLVTGMGMPPLTPQYAIDAAQTGGYLLTLPIGSVPAHAGGAIMETYDVSRAFLDLAPYDVSLFLTGIGQATGGDLVGGLTYAFGAPIAADLGIGTLLGFFEIEVLLDTLGMPLGWLWLVAGL